MERDMSHDKIKITSSVNGLPAGKVLLPIILFCLERGGKFQSKYGSAESPFEEERHGAICRLLGPTTIEDVLDAFDLPDTIIPNSPHQNCLRDTFDNTIVSFTSFEENEKYEITRRQRKEKSDALLDAALKKQGMKNA